MSNFKKTVCIDFDSVIHSYTSLWVDARTIPDPIVEGAIAFMLGAMAAGWEVVISSTRSHATSGVNAMWTWLREQSGQCWENSPAGPGIRNVRFPNIKPPAILYIDDRGFHFQGKFPTIEYMENFKTWNKRDTEQDKEVTENIGRWLSAALEDPQVCQEMKNDIIAWMNAGMPNIQLGV